MTTKKAPISCHTSAMLRIVFRPEQIAKYRAQGVEIEPDGSAVFGGSFQSFEASKPCFKIFAHAHAKAFGKRVGTDILLDWDPADILSVGNAYRKSGFLWKAEWGEQELVEAHGHEDE